MKKLIGLVVISILVAGCFQTGTIKVKTPDSQYEFSTDTNGVATIVISNDTYHVEFSADE